MPFISSIIAGASAIAGSIGAAFSAVSAFSVGGFSIGGAMLSLGLSMGLQAVASLFAKTPKTVPGAVTATLQIGGDIPRQVVFGSLGIKGQLVYSHTYGPSNSFLQMVIVLSDGWCGPITKIRVDDKIKQASDNTMQPVASVGSEVSRFHIVGAGTAYDNDEGGWVPSITVEYYDGRPGQTANARLVSHSAGRITSADRFAGMSYVIVTLRQHAGNFDAIPDLTFEFEGYRCYDPRKDSTAGGAGAHRRNDPATWEPSGNPSVQIYNYLIGITAENETFMGLDVQPYDLIDALWSAAANICDEAVTLDAGGTEPRYRAAHLITAQDNDHRAAIAPLLQAMSGYLVERSGAFGVIAGAAQMPVATITDDDLVIDRGVTWSASRSRTQRTNEVHGQFLDPATWQANSYPAIVSQSALDADGERLAVSLDFAAVTSVTQAQRIARARLRETRREATASITVWPKFCWLEAGDWIDWNSTLYGGSRRYRVMGRDLNPDDTVTLQLSEVGNEVYSWTAADEQPYIPPPPIPAGPALASTVQAFAVQPATVGDRPVYRLSWTPITDERITSVVVEYRPVGSTEATRITDDSPYDGSFTLDAPLSGVDYEFRATINTTPPRIVQWTGWVSATALEPYIPAGSIDLTALSSGLLDKITGTGPGSIGKLQSDIDLLARGVIDATAMFEHRHGVQQSDHARATQVLDSRVTETGVAIATLQTELEAETALGAAQYTELSQAIVDGDTALAGTVTAAKAVADDALALATSANASSASNTTAISTLNTSVNAVFGGNTAQALLSMTSVAQNGATAAEVRMGVRATVNGAMQESGLILRPNEVVVQSANFKIMGPGLNGGVPIELFSISGGKIRLNAPTEIQTQDIAANAVTSISIIKDVLSAGNILGAAPEYAGTGTSALSRRSLSNSVPATDPYIEVYFDPAVHVGMKIEFSSNIVSLAAAGAWYNFVLRLTRNLQNITIVNHQGAYASHSDIDAASVHEVEFVPVGTSGAGRYTAAFSYFDTPTVAGTYKYRVMIRSATVGISSAYAHLAVMLHKR